MSNTILIKRSGTANAVPLPANLALGELAINYTDGNLFYKDGGGTVNLRVSNQFVSVAGNITGGNLLAGTGIISTSGNITGGNLNAAGLSLSSNVLSALNSTSNITTSANVAASYFLGNGSQLTGIATNRIYNGTSEANIGTTDGNLAVTISGVGNVAVFTPTGLNITGVISANGNITGGNVDAGSGVITTSGNITGGNLLAGSGVITTSGNITGGNVLAGSGVITTSGNITGGNLLAGSGVITTSGNITGGNLLAGSGVITTSGNITGGNLNAAGLSLSSNVLSALNSTSNITTSANISGGNLLAGTGIISTSGNITGGNLNAAGLSLSSNVVSALNVTGNITGGNVNGVTGVYSGGVQVLTINDTVDGGTY